ncbi:MAG: T9SS type A sorting domain-containing protein [Candidatus Marinimicrobia bacterium]|nr:T9SS type A sorting domain-containing protein [Candidatus Neomarinimicrobiota bacterium]
MKKMLSIILATLVLGSFAMGGWEFDGVLADFPELTVSDSWGMHGVTVDNAGNIWYAMLGHPTAELYRGTAVGDTLDVYQIFAVTPAGVPLSFSPISTLTYGSVTDTLVSACRGMATDNDGNILYSIAGKLYKINGTTGAGMAMYDFPDVTGSLTCPAVDDAGNVYIGTVGPGNPVKILNSSLVETGNAIAEFRGAYTRSIAVSGDGKELYFGSTWNGIGIRHFHSDLPGTFPHDSASTIGGWQINDTTFQNLWPEAVSLGPDGNLYAANTQIGFTGDEAHGSRYWVYGTDGTEKYSFGAPLGDYTQGGIWNGRGCAWSPDGTIMYMADFGYNCVTIWNQVPDGVERPITLPTSFELKQNFPNPFNPSTTIAYELHQDGLVNLTVFDVKGREVATLVNEQLTAGNHVASFDGSNLSSGLYIYQLSFNGQVSAKNMMLIK